MKLFFNITAQSRRISKTTITLDALLKEDHVITNSSKYLREELLFTYARICENIII